MREVMGAPGCYNCQRGCNQAALVNIVHRQTYTGGEDELRTASELKSEAGFRPAWDDWGKGMRTHGGMFESRGNYNESCGEKKPAS
jgi:hypothetical protein